MFLIAQAGLEWGAMLAGCHLDGAAQAIEIGRVFALPAGGWGAAGRTSAEAWMEMSALSGEFSCPE